MVYAYIRVSTDRQDCENQKIGIDAKAQSLGLTIDRYIRDNGVSGARDPSARALGGCLGRLRSGDVIICSELSRLGRRMFMIMHILEHCTRRGAKVYTVKDNYELNDNIQSKVLAFAFGIAAEIERDLISARTREALTARRSAGISLGRRRGDKNRHHKMDGRGDIVRQMLHDGYSQRKIARHLRVSPPTIARFLKTVP